MDFTEIREVDDTTFYARNSHTQTRQGLFSTQASLATYNPDFLHKPSSDNILDYEKILKDTPPGSPGFTLVKNQTIQKIIGEGKNDTVDEIIMTIEVSLQERAKAESLLITEDKKPQKQQQQVNFSDRTTDCGDSEEILEFGSKPFEKVPSEIVSKSYIETKGLKSFLSEGIKNLPSPRGGNTNIKRGEMKTFKEISLLIPLNISLRVINIIEQCLDSYKSSKGADLSLLKHPDQPNAYEIKLGADSSPLDKKKELKSFPLSKDVGELFFEESADYDEKNKENPFSEENEIITVCVYLPDEAKPKVTLDMKGSNLLKDVYTMLTAQKFPGCTSQHCNIQIYSESNSNEAEVKPVKGQEQPKIFLDTQVPLRNLKKYIKEDNILYLELVKKKFADDPTENRKHSDIIKELAGSPQEETHQDQIILYNEVSANRYEEFEVIKINESGRRQTRILGIDGFKIYNYTKKYKQEQQGGGVFSSVFYSKFGTMNPEFILLNINKVELVEPNGFSIETKAEGNQLKTIFFEALDRKKAKQIVAKLTYLKELEEKTMSYENQTKSMI